MENLTQYTNYEQFKQELDTEIRKTAESFVKIGYLLNLAATTGILMESGYANVNEMAWNEYKIDDSQVSRFINIYREFGVEGQPMLQERYREHGVAKLGLMLTLPQSVREEIPASYSKSEINELKKEIEKEKKISDIEVEIEKAEMKESVQYTLPQGLQQAVHQLVHDEPEIYAKLYDAVEMEDFKAVLVPAGEQTYIVRIKGIGRIAVFMRAEADITVINIRENHKESYSWQQLVDAYKEYFGMGGDAAESWSNVFLEPFPAGEKPEPVKSEPPKPVKPDKDNVKKAKPKKESKVKVVEPKPEKEPVTECHQLEEQVKESEEQLPGQDSILNHPEYLPDSMKEDKPEVLTGEVVDCGDNAAQEENGTENPEEPQSDNVQQSSDGMKAEYIAPVQDAGEEHIVRSLKKVLKASVETLGVMAEKEDWPMVISKATDIVHRAKKIQELEEKK